MEYLKSLSKLMDGGDYPALQVELRKDERLRITMAIGFYTVHREISLFELESWRTDNWPALLGHMKKELTGV